MNNYKTVIMAGGRGSRISKLFPDIPKPLIPIKDKNGIERAVLEWEIRSLVKQNFKEIILTVGYRAEQIKDYFGTGEKFGANIFYFVEDSPLGNAGALFKMRDFFSEPFLLLNADAVFEIDFNRMVEFHNSHNGFVTLFTHPNSHPYDSGLIFADKNNMVTSWLTKEDTRPQFYKNRVNAGIHVIDPYVLDLTAKRLPFDVSQIGDMDEKGNMRQVDLDRQILKPLCNTGLMYCYDSPEYVKDMGTPERFFSVFRDFQNGIVTAKNLTKRQKAVFLDRDGTLNKYVGFLKDIAQFELIDGVVDAIKLINESGYLAIVVSNQPVVARGEFTFDQLQNIHNKLETLLCAEGAYLDAIYYCPHHPDKGYVGEISQLKINCNCRKPKPGMLIKASKDFNIDFRNSWMIGDSETDIKAGKTAGCKTVLIGKSGNYGQDLTVGNLLEAIKEILGK